MRSTVNHGPDLRMRKATFKRRTNVERVQMEEELSDFEKGQVVVLIGLGVSVTETARMVGCSRAAVVSSYRRCYEEGRRLRAGRSKVIEPRELEEEEAGGGGAAAEEETSSEGSQEKPEEGEST